MQNHLMVHSDHVNHIFDAVSSILGRSQAFGHYSDERNADKQVCMAVTPCLCVCVCACVRVFVCACVITVPVCLPQLVKRDSCAPMSAFL